MQRVLATFLALSAALAAQDPALPSLELPRTDAWFDDPEHGNAPTALVVVKHGHAPWIRTTGHVDAEGRVPLAPDSWVPLCGLTARLLLPEAVRIERDERGLDPTATLAASAPDAVAGLDPVFGELTWADLLVDHQTPAPYYQRWLEGGATPRPLTEILSAHAFPAPRRGSSGGDMWAAILQGGIEQRRNEGWEALVRGPISAALGARLEARRPTDAPAWSNDTGTAAPVVTDREVAAAAGAWLRLDSAPSMLATLGARGVGRLRDPALGGFHEASDAPVFVAYDAQLHGPQFSRNLDHGEVTAELRIYGGEAGVAMFAVTGLEGEGLMATAAKDLFGTPGDEQTLFGGRGGGGGWRALDTPPRLDRRWIGRYEGEVQTLAGTLAVRLDVRSDDPRTIDCFLDGSDVVETSSGDRSRADVTVPRAQSATLRFELDHAGDELVGVVHERDGESSLPWRVRLARAGEAAEPLPPLGELIAALGVAERMAHATGALPTARVLGFWTEASGASVAVAGRPDPEGEAVLAYDDRVPFATLSKAVTWRTLESLHADGRLDLDAPIADWIGVVPGWRDAWQRATPRALLTDVGLPIYFRHVGDPAARRSAADVVRAHSFPMPDWIRPDRDGEFGFGLITEALDRSLELADAVDRSSIDVAAEIATRDGLAVLTGPLPHRVRIVEGGAVRSVRFGEVPLAFHVEGTADAALDLGAALLRRLTPYPDELPWGARRLGDVGGRGLPSFGWQDDREGAIRLQAWPALGLVMFAFDAGGEDGWIDALTDAVLERAEPATPSTASGKWNASYYRGHKAVARYTGSWSAGDETFAIELRNAWPRPELSVDGRALDFDLRSYEGEDIVLHAPLGDGRSLWIAVRHYFLSAGLKGVGWLVEPGASMLPYPLLLRRR